MQTLLVNFGCGHCLLLTKIVPWIILVMLGLKHYRGNYRFLEMALWMVPFARWLPFGSKALSDRAIESLHTLRVFTQVPKLGLIAIRIGHKKALEPGHFPQFFGFVLCKLPSGVLVTSIEGHF